MPVSPVVLVPAVAPPPAGAAASLALSRSPPAAPSAAECSSPANSWNASIIWHACQMIDAYTPCLLLTTARRRSRSRSTQRPMRDARSGRTTPRAVLMMRTTFTTAQAGGMQIDQDQAVHRQTRSLAAAHCTNGSNAREQTHARVHSGDEGQVSVAGPARMTEVDQRRRLRIPLSPMTRRTLMLLVMRKVRTGICPRVD